MHHRNRYLGCPVVGKGRKATTRGQLEVLLIVELISPIADAGLRATENGRLHGCRVLLLPLPSCFSGRLLAHGLAVAILAGFLGWLFLAGLGAQGGEEVASGQTHIVAGSTCRCDNQA